MSLHEVCDVVFWLLMVGLYAAQWKLMVLHRTIKRSADAYRETTDALLAEKDALIFELQKSLHQARFGSGGFQ